MESKGGLSVQNTLKGYHSVYKGRRRERKGGKMIEDYNSRR